MYFGLDQMEWKIEFPILFYECVMIWEEQSLQCPELRMSFSYPHHVVLPSCSDLLSSHHDVVYCQAHSDSFFSCFQYIDFKDKCAFSATCAAVWSLSVVAVRPAASLTFHKPHSHL